MSVFGWMVTGVCLVAAAFGIFGGLALLATGGRVLFHDDEDDTPDEWEASA
jgi:hypothetical protein